MLPPGSPPEVDPVTAPVLSSGARFVEAVDTDSQPPDDGRKPVSATIVERLDPRLEAVDLNPYALPLYAFDDGAATQCMSECADATTMSVFVSDNGSVTEMCRAFTVRLPVELNCSFMTTVPTSTAPENRVIDWLGVVPTAIGVPLMRRLVIVELPVQADVGHEH
jgi:hypothetical protein